MVRKKISDNRVIHTLLAIELKLLNFEKEFIVLLAKYGAFHIFSCKLVRAIIF